MFIPLCLRSERKSMRHRPNHTYWRDHDNWVCGRHLPASPLPASVEKCWLCPNKRPSMKDRPDPDVKAPPLLTQPKQRVMKPRARVVLKPTVADLVGNAAPESGPPPAAPRSAPKAAKTAVKPTVNLVAADGNPPICAWADCCEPARPRSKYCSRNCSNKNARARHKTRAKS